MAENNKPKQTRKGHTNNPNGRPAGTPNKATTAFRETVTRLLEGNAENVSIWLDQVATGNGDPDKADPAKALDLLAKLAEFAAPKLSRAEVAGDPDAPIKTVIEWQQ